MQKIPVAQDFYIQPGVLLSTKGATSEDNSDVKIKLSYIEIPINLLYKPVLGDGKLLLGFGPYIAFGVGGKLKDDGESIDVEFEKENLGSSVSYRRALFQTFRCRRQSPFLGMN